MKAQSVILIADDIPHFGMGEYPTFCDAGYPTRLFRMPEPLDPLRFFEMEIRVRYHETDGQRRVHHGQYLNYFERARVEMLRQAGISYRDLEDSGLLLVVRSIEVEYHAPARFDDLLRVTVETTAAAKVRIEHTYRVFRDADVIVSAKSLIVCVDETKGIVRLPPELRLD